MTYFVDTGTFLGTRGLVNWDGGGDSTPRANLVDGWLDVDGTRFPDGYVLEGRDRGSTKTLSVPGRRLSRGP